MFSQASTLTSSSYFITPQTDELESLSSLLRTERVGEAKRRGRWPLLSFERSTLLLVDTGRESSLGLLRPAKLSTVSTGRARRSLPVRSSMRTRDLARRMGTRRRNVARRIDSYRVSTSLSHLKSSTWARKGAGYATVLLFLSTHVTWRRLHGPCASWLRYADQASQGPALRAAGRMVASRGTWRFGVWRIERTGGTAGHRRWDGVR